MDDQTELPEGFEDLAPFLADWGDLTGQDERYRRRQGLPMARLTSYYEAVKPRLADIFACLDRHPYGQPLPPREERLRRLVMAMTEVSQAVEVFGQPAIPRTPLGHSVRVETMSRV